MAAKPPRSWLKSAGTNSTQPPAATPRDAVSKAGGGARTAGSASASAADVGALGPRRPAPRSASLSPANFAPQTEAAFEKRPAQQPFGDPTCIRRAESEASRAAGVGSLAGGRWGRAPCEHLPPCEHPRGQSPRRELAGAARLGLAGARCRSGMCSGRLLATTCASEPRGRAQASVAQFGVN